LAASNYLIRPGRTGRSIWLAICLTLFAPCAFSSSTIPYDPGDTQQVSSAAARIVDVECIRTFDENIFTFDVEVFADCWKPVYAIRLEVLDEMPLDGVAWPPGWHKVENPLMAMGDGGLGFATDANPIRPGSRLSGFAVSTPATNAAVRWFPADAQGTLIGKATRLTLSCPTGVEPQTWGSIKALFR